MIFTCHYPACQILRTLKKPFPIEKNDPRNSPVAHVNASPSLDFVLPDAQCQSKDLNLQGGGNHKGDFSECASQTSLPGTPDIKSTSSQYVPASDITLQYKCSKFAVMRLLAFHHQFSFSIFSIKFNMTKKKSHFLTCLAILPTDT